MHNLRSTSFLTTTIFLSLLLITTTPYISAQEEEKTKEPITKEELLSLFEKNKFVEDRVIDGVDIMWIIQKTDYVIKINNSIIKGGLNFSLLPEVSVNEVDLPEKWIEKQYEVALRKNHQDWKLRIVGNSISIVNSEIQKIRSGDKYIGSVNAENTFFYKDANFSGTTFTGRTNFYRATFNREALFYAAKFTKNASFSRATFNMKASFDGITFKKKARFIGATFKKKTGFSGTTFTETVFFSEATFIKYANFVEATFNKQASFKRTIFTENAVFSSATFIGWAIFSDAKFSECSFRRTTFNKQANFDRSTFKKEANFSSATFTKNASFSRVTFNKAVFPAVTFSEYANFNRVTFKKEANFIGATFNKSASFIIATFTEYTSFNRTIFIEKAIFTGAVFKELAYFHEATLGTLVMNLTKFEKYADFRNVSVKRLNFLNFSPNVIQGRIDFRNAVITDAHFQNIVFEKDADFSDVRFGNTKNHSAVIFKYITFESDAYFIRTTFSINTDTEFERINFKKDANFTNAKFVTNKGTLKQKFSLSYVNFSKLIISWKQLPNPDIWTQAWGEKEDRIKSFVNIKNERDKILVGFSNQEFQPPFTASILQGVIIDDKYDIGHDLPKDPIKWINGLLEISGFYDIVSKKTNFRFSERLINLVNLTTDSRKQKYKDLKKEEKYKIKKLNRLILEEVYPQLTPKFEKAERREPLHQVFENLETTFRNQNKLRDANQAHYLKKLEELKDSRKKKPLFWSRFEKEVEWYLLGFPCGYAMKIGRMCVVSGSIYILFALLFCTGGRLKKADTGEKHEFAIRPRLFDFPSKTIEEIGEKNEKGNRFVNALIYSLFMLLKIGYNDRKISKKIFRINTKYFIWVGWIIGYWLLATITMTIYNTVPTINRLISGVF